MMDQSVPWMGGLAQRLLAAEAASKAATGAPAHEAVRLCEKLRISLTRFAGADGFLSLLRRAVVLAQADIPAMKSIRVRADGSLEGFNELVAGASDSDGGMAVAITAHLLRLLVTFIGEPLTLRLVRESWPALSLDV